MERPIEKEYAASYQQYIDLVESGDFIELLDQNTDLTIAFFESIYNKIKNLKYAEDILQ